MIAGDERAFEEFTDISCRGFHLLITLPGGRGFFSPHEQDSLRSTQGGLHE